MAIFKGAGVAIVTPMKENGDINYDKLEELIEFQIAEGTDCIVIAGTTGESSTMTMEEHSKVIKAAVDFTKHRVPVVAGSGSNCTREAIYLSKEAEAAGADGLLAVTPYYNKATQGGLIRYYSEIAAETKLPIIMYNVPGRTGCNILPETAAHLFKNVDNIVGIKDSSQNMKRICHTVDIKNEKKPDFSVFCGTDDMLLPALTAGCVGSMTAMSAILPEANSKIYSLFNEGKIKEAQELNMSYLKLVRLCDSLPFPAGYKLAFEKRGFKMGNKQIVSIEGTDEYRRIEAEMEKEIKKFI